MREIDLNSKCFFSNGRKYQLSEKQFFIFNFIQIMHNNI